MAIDVLMNDRIDDSIRTKLLAIGTAAATADRKVTKLIASLDKLGGKGTLSGLANGAFGGGSTSRAVASSAKSNKRYEPANVTAVRNLEKQRKEIAAVFERGFKDRESAAKLAEVVRQREAKAQAAYNAFVATENSKAIKVQQAAAAAQARIDAQNLKARDKNRAEITAVFERGFKEREAIAARATRGLLAQQINQRQGISAPKPSATDRRSQQDMYNRLFDAQKTTKVTSPINAASTRALTTYSQSLGGAVRGTKELSGAMQHLQTSTSFLRSDGLRWAKVLWALGGATLTAGAIVEAADAYTRLQNRLQVVTETQGQVNYLTDEMLRISIASRQPVEEVAKSFARFDLAVKQLGKSQTDTLLITENVSKALKLGGATAGEAASALLQLSQAFNKGKLDGDEFRSLMENSPILADALAKKLAVTRGELLKLAPEGKISLKVMTDAILGATKDINTAFAKLKPTIAESFTVLRSSAIVFFGELDKQLGVTSALSSLIIGLANNLDVLTFAALAVAPALAIFAGTKILGGLASVAAFAGRAAVAVGAIRSPITIAAGAIMNMGRAAVTSGALMTAAFSSATGRAIALQAATVGAAAGVAALGNVAKRTGAMLLAAFSFGNIVMVIGTLIAAAIAFGDELVVSAEKGLTLRDVTIAGLKEIGSFMADVWNTAFDYVYAFFTDSTSESMSFSEKIKVIFLTVQTTVATVFDYLITGVKLVYNVVRLIFNGIGELIVNAFKTAINDAIFMINGLIGAFNVVGQAANKALGWMGFQTDFGKTQTIDYLKIDYSGTKSAAEDIANTVVSTVARDAATAFNQRVLDRAAKDKEKKDSNLRGTGNNLVKDAGDDKKGKKKKTDEEKRADIIAKVVHSEEAAIKTAKLLGDERERVATITDLNNKLLEKGYALLSDSETAHISSLVKQRLAAERVGEAMKTIYDNTLTKLMQDYTAAGDAVDEMLKRNLITQEHAINLQKKAKDEFTAATDPVDEFTKALEKTTATYGKFGIEAAVATAMYDKYLQLIAEGKPPMTPEQSQQLIRVVTQTERLAQAQAALNSVWESTKGATEDIKNNFDALEEAYSVGWVSLSEYRRQYAGLAAEMGRNQEMQFGVNDPLEPIKRGFYQLVSEMPSIGQAMADAIQNTLGSAVDGIADSMTTFIMDFDGYAQKMADDLGKPVTALDVMRSMLGDIAKQIATDLVKAIIKMGVQWVITQAMQSAASKAAIATTTAAQVSSNAAIATSAAPAAMATSVASFGGASAAGIAGMTAAMMAVAGIMAIAGASKFADGSGIIKGAGSGRSDSILARLSNGEMVMNAQAVRENYPALSAMNNGDSVGGGAVINNTSIQITYAGDGTSRANAKSDDLKLATDIKTMVDGRIYQIMRESRQQGHDNY